MTALAISQLAGLSLETAEGDYTDRFATSSAMFERARRVIAGGTTHDGWMLEPFPLYVSRASGAHKWDIAGRQLIDYWMGHGALIKGHAFPPVVDAIATQAAKSSHYGAPSELEVQWAELVCDLIPSAERVRFTSSGTEATLLALRIARAYTGRRLVIKLDGNFHGWHDESLAHFVSQDAAGLNPGTIEQVVTASPFDIDFVVELLAEQEAAALILEPGGGGSGGLPYSKGFLTELRAATIAHGSLLIFDEVVSAFRYSPGGVQELCGVLPDLTVLAKILCGGLPGGAVAGPAQIMNVFGTGALINDRRIKVPHSGTFNGNPLSAAAGITLLSHLKDGTAQAQADSAALDLVQRVNQIADEQLVDVHLYQQSSIFHILVGAHQAELPLEPSAAVIELYSKRPELYATLRRALLSEGLDTHPVHGWLSTFHDQTVIERSAEAFERAFRHLRNVPGIAL